MGRLLYPEGASLVPPRTRADCIDGPRPCAFASCRYHLWAELKDTAVRINFPDVEIWDLNYSCALDLADAGQDRGGMTLEAVGKALNITRERARQIESEALHKLASLLLDAQRDEFM